MHNLHSFYAEFDVELDINEENVRRCNNVSHFDSGLVIKNSYLCTYEKFFKAFPPKDCYTGEQSDALLKRANKWKGLIEDACNDELHRRAEYVPVNVAGPARYNFDKAEKQVDRMMTKSCEYGDKIRAFIENTQKILERLTPSEVVIAEYRNGKREDDVSSDDPAALEKLNARLEFLMEEQTRMKSMNQYYRKHKTMKGFPRWSDAGTEKLDAAIKTHYSWEQVPYPSYELTSINGKIKRCTARIESITALRTDKPIDGFKFDGGEVIANYEENRLQVIFEDKPDEEMRNLLKSHGFRWSPRFTAWQRQLTKNAYYEAKRILKTGGNENV